MRGAFTIMATIFVAILGPVGPASATASCSFSAGTATVILDSAGDAATLRLQGDAITLNGSACEAATAGTTDTVSVQDVSGGGSSLTIDLGGGALAPGATDEVGSSDEIEVDVDLGIGSDQLTVLGGAVDDNLAADALGLNLNAGEEGGLDIDVSLGGVESLSLDGAGGNDQLAAGGASSSAVVTGGPGADRLSGGSGPDTFIGGAGFDTVDYSSSSAAVTVTIGDGLANDGRAGEGDNVTGDVEHVIGSAFDDRITGDTSAELLVGGSGADRLAGRAGDDELRGEDGNDLLLGGGNDDYLIGGPGNDDERGEAGNDAFTPNPQAHVESYLSVPIKDPGTTTATLNVSGLASSINDLNVRIDVNHPATQQLRIVMIPPAGGRVALSLNRGNGTAMRGTVFDSEAVTNIRSPGSKPLEGRFHPEHSMETFRGQNPNGTWRLEIVDGTAGGVGTLNLWRLQFVLPSPGGDGDDILSGGSGPRDIIDWSGRTQDLTATLAGGTDDGQAGEADNIGAGLGDIEDCYAGSGDDLITGTAVRNDLRGQTGNDHISGLGEADELRGRQGTDSIFGGDGGDSIQGGPHNDSIDGGAGTDVANYGGAAAAVTVNLGAGTTSGAEGSDSLVNLENILGSKFNDTLVGAATVNAIIAGAGNDSLSGLTGNDRLDGQAGTDSANGGDGTDLCLSAETRVSCES